MPRTRIMYVEQMVAGALHRGPAWISRVQYSKSGRSVYFRGRELLNVGRGDYQDVATGERFWVSGPKKNRQDRHWAGGGQVEIDDDIREEYFKLIGSK